MKFFKYLVFIIISLFSVETFAYYYTIESSLPGISGKQFPSPVSACQYYADFMGYTYISVTQDGRGSYKYNCNTKTKQNYDAQNGIQELGQATKCPASGYPIPTYFEPNTPIPLRVCKQNPDGTYCVYDAQDKINPLVISSGNYQNITLRSVSEIPSPSCTPEFSKDRCDPKDPYGGCYQPPDDNCNRMADGSIYCPDGVPPPPIKSGCQNGATYCDMPPTGCGTGYVPGNFNGKQICVKNSNPPPTDPPDQPPPASDPPPIDPPDPTDPPDGDPPPPVPPPPVPPDNGPILRAILDAINAVNNKLTWLKNELVNSLNYVAKKIDVTNSKLDTTNQKLDAVNSSVKETTAAVKETTAAVNNVKAAVDANATTVKTAVEANTAATNNVKSAVDANTNSTANKLNEVVNAINNNPVGGGGGGSTDVTPVVNAIEKQTTDFKDMMKTDSSDFDTSQYEKIGDASDDPRSLNAQSEAAGSLQALSNKLTFSNSACVQDFTVTVPIYGSLTVPLSQWCDLLALVKILLHLCTLMVAFKMLDSTVRAI